MRLLVDDMCVECFRFGLLCYYIHMFYEFMFCDSDVGDRHLVDQCSAGRHPWGIFPVYVIALQRQKHSQTEVTMWA